MAVRWSLGMVSRLAALALVLAAFGVATPASAQRTINRVRPQPVLSVPQWSGFYGGVNLGHSWGSATTEGQAGTTTTTTTTVYDAYDTPFQTISSGPTTVVTQGPLSFFNVTTPVTGAIGGVQFGLNRQFDRWVFGFETDFQGSAQRASFVTCVPALCGAGSSLITGDFSLRWLGTTRARAGWLALDNLLAYVTGGLAYGVIDAGYTGGIGGGTLASGTFTRIGWTAGFGSEYRFDSRWSIKLEYLFVDLGSFGLSGTGAASTSTAVVPNPQLENTAVITTATSSFMTARTRFVDHILRIGVNYGFGMP